MTDDLSLNMASIPATRKAEIKQNKFIRTQTMKEMFKNNNQSKRTHFSSDEKQHSKSPLKADKRDPFKLVRKKLKEKKRSNLKKNQSQEVPQVQPEAAGQALDKTPIQSLQLHLGLKTSLERNGILRLTEIQRKCFLPISEGKAVIAKAETGSGKTLAYLIPSVDRLLKQGEFRNRSAGTLVLVVCPTRQLCIQADREALRCLKRSPFFVSGCLFGGENPAHEKMRLRKGVCFLFCTPGRLLYHLQNTKSFLISNLRVLIFEEADRTLDLGFQREVEHILRILRERLDFNRIQQILVSAHFNERVQSLIDNLELGYAEQVGFESKRKMEDGSEGEQEVNASSNLTQRYILVSEDQRLPLTLAYLRGTRAKVLVFVATISEVELIQWLLSSLTFRDCNGNKTEEPLFPRPIFKLHGDLDQKTRSDVYFNFRKAKSAIMVSTEVASRGLDFPDLEHIVLFDPPNSLADYGNRIGRTARFNRPGASLLFLHYHQSDFAENIRYHCPQLQLLDRDALLRPFIATLREQNIGESPTVYLQSIVRAIIHSEPQKRQLARSAYVAMLRAYIKSTQLRPIAATCDLRSETTEFSSSCEGIWTKQQHKYTDENQITNGHSKEKKESQQCGTNAVYGVPLIVFNTKNVEFKEC